MDRSGSTRIIAALRAWREVVPRGLHWIAIYLVLAMTPLGLRLIPPAPPPRSFLVEVGLGLGYVGLSLLSLQFALGARGPRAIRAIGLDTVLLFHRQAGLWAAAFTLGHVLLLWSREPFYVAHLLDHQVNAPRALALGFVLVGLLFLVLVPRRLHRLQIPYEVWRVTHGALAMAVACIGLWHALSVGGSTLTLWKEIVVAAVVLGAVSLLGIAHVVRPAIAMQRPFRVVRVRKEREHVFTLVIEAEGHEGLRFRAGQSIWLTLGRSAFSPRQHPFTIASSALSPARIELTIKEFGDFTSGIGSVALGTRAFLDGPYGAFALDYEQRRPLVCVAGGIGITPIMSMIRTLHDLADRRPVLLFYGNDSLDKVVFAVELRELAQAMNLNVVHVLEHPPPGWEGESGRMRSEIFDRHLGEAYAGAEFFVCGPEPMMNLVELALRERGVRSSRIHAEHFAFVGSRPPGRRSFRERRVRLLAFAIAQLLLVAVLATAAFRVG